MEGKIESITFNPDWKRWNLKIGGLEMSAFENEPTPTKPGTPPELKALMRELKRGDLVKVETIESKSQKTGKMYLNIDTLERVIQTRDVNAPPLPSGAIVPPADTPKGKAVPTQDYGHTDIRISRGGACHDAAEVVAAEIRMGRKFADARELTDYFLNLADTIAHFILTGE